MIPYIKGMVTERSVEAEALAKKQQAQSAANISTAQVGSQIIFLLCVMYSL